MPADLPPTDPAPPHHPAHVSAFGLDFIGRWEGIVLHVYLDAAGLPTIGFGHLIRPGEHFTTITQAEAIGLLAIDVGQAEDAVHRGIHVPLGGHQFDALCSFAFNCGSGAVTSSTLARRLNLGEYDAVPPLLLEWCKAGGLPNAGLLNRRRSEAAVWALPDSPAAGLSETDRALVLAQVEESLAEITRGLDVEPPDGAAV